MVVLAAVAAFPSCTPVMMLMRKSGQFILKSSELAHVLLYIRIGCCRHFETYCSTVGGWTVESDEGRNNAVIAMAMHGNRSGRRLISTIEQI